MTVSPEGVTTSEYLPSSLSNQPDSSTRGPGQKMHPDCHQFDATFRMCPQIARCGPLAEGAEWICRNMTLDPDLAHASLAPLMLVLRRRDDFPAWRFHEILRLSNNLILATHPLSYLGFLGDFAGLHNGRSNSSSSSVLNSR